MQKWMCHVGVFTMAVIWLICALLFIIGLVGGIAYFVNPGDVAEAMMFYMFAFVVGIIGLLLTTLGITYLWKELHSLKNF